LHAALPIDTSARRNEQSSGWRVTGQDCRKSIRAPRGSTLHKPFAKQIHEFDVNFEDGRQLQPAELFKRPFPVELMGAGFDIPINFRYFALRFPRVLKIHEDRSFKDTVSLEELQEMTRRCEEAPEDSEMKRCIGLGGCKDPTFWSKDRGPTLPMMIQILCLSQRLLAWVRITSMLIVLSPIHQSERWL